MMINQWLKVSQDVVNKPISSRSRGARVQVMLSPSDVPSEVRSFKEGEKYFVIEFRYLTSPERCRDEKSKNGVVLTLGKNSGRIYRIKIDCDHIVNNFNGELAIEMMVDAEDDISGRYSSEINPGNKDAINNLMKSKYSQMLGLA